MHAPVRLWKVRSGSWSVTLALTLTLVDCQVSPVRASEGMSKLLVLWEEMEGLSARSYLGLGFGWIDQQYA